VYDQRLATKKDAKPIEADNFRLTSFNRLPKLYDVTGLQKTAEFEALFQFVTDFQKSSGTAEGLRDSLAKIAQYIKDQPPMPSNEVFQKVVSRTTTLQSQLPAAMDQRYGKYQSFACATALNQEITRVVVTHHPFDLPAGIAEHNLVGSARAAFERWAACGADLLLCGHLHLADATTTLSRFGGDNPHAIVVTAGTATSTRGRGARNSFNAIRVENRQTIEVARWCWDPESKTFRQGAAARFERSTAGWTRTAGSTSTTMILSHC
jgi:hypothetical protein